jgi:hypothetical protein
MINGNQTIEAMFEEIKGHLDVSFEAISSDPPIRHLNWL